ncbi:MAG TPA: hypothetical protein VFO19_11670 [Vicinamibacterales bacterium]|nr:hypothetical protein [Vicinamibacterales bacterium]
MHTHEAEECGVCRVPAFERNNYFHGKTLSARDLFAEQRYFNEKRWLLNRMVFGWGVVCGLEVSQEGDCLTVSPGLALDCCGRELVVCGRRSVHVQTAIEQLGSEAGYAGASLRWMLCLDYRECEVEPVVLPNGCEPGDRGREHNRIREEYRLRFRIATDRCPDDQSGDCCPHPAAARTTPIQKTLVERSRRCPDCDDCCCVVLATGWLQTAAGGGGQLKIDEDSWKYRRTVHTNRALGDLFRCVHGGLTRITTTSWVPNSVYSVDNFVSAMREGLKVTFDRPMDAASVANPRSCRLSIAVMSEDYGCPVQILVPIVRIDYAGVLATYYFDASCAEYELRKTCQKHQRPAEVELVLHGSMLIDTTGRALDAELIRDFPTGNGVEGGEFIAGYTVQP